MQKGENLANSQSKNSQNEPINGSTITERSTENLQSGKFDFSKIFKFIKNYELSKHLLLMIFWHSFLALGFEFTGFIGLVSIRSFFGIINL